MQSTHEPIRQIHLARTRTPSTRPRRFAGLAVIGSSVLSAALAAVALADQLGPRTLAEHADSVYAPHGVEASPTLLYGLLYAGSAIATVVWLVAHRATRARAWWPAPLMGSAAVATSTTLALLLLLVGEYDAQTYPPVWGLVAALPVLTGCAAVVLLTRSASVAGDGHGL